jgi:hypothetical protein
MVRQLLSAGQRVTPEARAALPYGVIDALHRMDWAGVLPTGCVLGRSLSAESYGPFTSQLQPRQTGTAISRAQH